MPRTSRFLPLGNETLGPATGTLHLWTRGPPTRPCPSSNDRPTPPILHVPSCSRDSDGTATAGCPCHLLLAVPPRLCDRPHWPDYRRGHSVHRHDGVPVGVSVEATPSAPACTPTPATTVDGPGTDPGGSKRLGSPVRNRPGLRRKARSACYLLLEYQAGQTTRTDLHRSITCSVYMRGVWSRHDLPTYPTR